MKNLEIMVIGDKGHGKSTVIEQLLCQAEAFTTNNSSKTVHTPEKEFSLVSNQSIKRQIKEIAEDIALVEFKSVRQNYTFTEISDHKQSLKYLATAATHTQAAILIIDAWQGITSQTYQYAHMLALFGIEETVIVINKMDLKLYNRIKFWEISEEITDLFNKLNIQVIASIPVSAKYGDNIMVKSDKMRWNCSPALMKSLDYLSGPRNMTQLPLRLLVHEVHSDRHANPICAKIVSGKLFKNHQLTFGPAYHVANVLSIETSAGEETTAEAGQTVALGMDNADDVKVGQVGFNVCHPPLTTDYLVTDVFWIGSEPLKPGDKIDILCGATLCSATVETIPTILEPACIEITYTYNNRLAESQVGNIRIKLDRPVCIDPFNSNALLGKFVIIKDSQITGGGVIK